MRVSRKEVFDFFKDDNSETFHLRYLLRPATGRRPADYLLDGLSLLVVILAWISLLIHPEKIGEMLPVGIAFTLVVLVLLAFACRDVKEVKGFNGKMHPIAPADKPDYATLQRLRALEASLFFPLLTIGGTTEIIVFIIIPVIACVVEIAFYYWRYKKGRSFLP